MLIKTTLFTFLAYLITPVSAQEVDATVDLPDSIAGPGTEVVWIKQLPSYCEGPAVDPQGVLYFTEQLGNQTQNWPIWKIDPGDPGDEGSIFLEESSQANGLQFDVSGKLVAAQNQVVTRYHADASVDAVLARSGQGATFNQANDLSVATNGSLYFTDLASNVFYVDTEGNLSVVYSNANGANGIEYLEEKGLVYLNEASGNRVTMFDVGEDGALENPRNFLNAPVPDGATFDEHGNYYVGSYGDGAVIVFNAQGQEIGRVTLNTTGQWDSRRGQQGNVCNCFFGGQDNSTLYFTGDGGAYAIDLEIPGRRLPDTTVTIRRFPGTPSPVNQGQAAFFFDGFITPIPGLTAAKSGYIEYLLYDLQNRRVSEGSIPVSLWGRHMAHLSSRFEGRYFIRFLGE